MSVKKIIADAEKLASFWRFLNAFDFGEREEWIADFEADGRITHEQAEILRAHNAEKGP